MISEGRIQKTQERITRLLAEQCAHGAQQDLLPADCAACGQFVGSSAKSKQRGLHGTAAALRVLAQSAEAEHSGLVPRLVKYIEQRDTLFQSGKEPNSDKRAFQDDQENVMKLSEVLYALSFVTPGQCRTEELQTQLAKKLLDALKGHKGWSYFLSGNDAPDILPTAFAVLALSRVGGYEPQIARQVEWLKEMALDQRGGKGADIIETSVRTFCLFALTYRLDDVPKDELRRLRQAFMRQWETLEALLAQDLEQNIEYSRGGPNYYVRIPWQLYLVALAARLQARRLWSFSAQKRLEQITDAVLSDGGFRYPYSGASLSSRTNAILFDTLDKIRRSTRSGWMHRVFYWVDRTRTVLSHPAFSWLTLLVVVGVVAYCVYSWVINSGKPGDLGRSLTGSLVMLTLSYFLERIRKTR